MGKKNKKSNKQNTEMHEICKFSETKEFTNSKTVKRIKISGNIQCSEISISKDSFPIIQVEIEKCNTPEDTEPTINERNTNIPYSKKNKVKKKRNALPYCVCSECGTVCSCEASDNELKGSNSASNDMSRIMPPGFKSDNQIPDIKIINANKDKIKNYGSFTPPRNLSNDEHFIPSFENTAHPKINSIDPNIIPLPIRPKDGQIINKFNSLDELKKSLPKRMKGIDQREIDITCSAMANMQLQAVDRCYKIHRIRNHFNLPQPAEMSHENLETSEKKDETNAKEKLSVNILENIKSRKITDCSPSEYYP